MIFTTITTTCMVDYNMQIKVNKTLYPVISDQ